MEGVRISFSKCVCTMGVGGERVCMHTTVHVWGLEDDFVELVLSFRLYLDSRDLPRPVRLVQRMLHPLSCLTGS